MLLEPKSVKYKKMHNPKVSFVKKEFRDISGNFGSYSIKAMTAGRVTNKQLEAARKILAKRFKKQSKIRLCIFPYHSITAKPAEVRMGKGKGKVEGWVCLVKQGKVIMEIEGLNITSSEAKKGLEEAGEKLPIKIKFFENRN